MPLTDAQLSLIDAANAVIDAVPRGTIDRQLHDHTVGCAALSSDGRIFTGVNVFHFTGGPCAESGALSNAAAAGLASANTPGIGDGATLTTIVAVANDQRGVISPCGRCRQMLLDYYPDIRVIVKDGEDLKTVGTLDLLPYAYKHRQWASHAYAEKKKEA